MTTAALATRRLPALLVALGMAGAAFAVPGMILGTATAATAAPANPATQGYQISPPVTTLALDKGTSSRQTIKVTNLTDAQLTLQVGKRNFVAKGEEGEVELTDTNADPNYTLAPYFTISQPTVTVPPRGTSNVQFVLSVPETAEPGGRYGSITFNTIAATLPTGQSGASVRQELAALVFLRINGAANEQLKIASFTAGKPESDAKKVPTPFASIPEYGPIALTTRVQNLGNVHEKPTGDIVITNMLGGTTARLKLDPKNVIPGAIRRTTTTLNQKLLFGRYSAKLTLKNGTQQTLTASTSFTVIPYKLIAVVIIVLLVMTFIIRRGRKRFGRAIRILAGGE